MRKIASFAVMALASIALVGQFETGMAFKNLLKKTTTDTPSQKTEVSEPAQPAATSQQTATTSSGPVLYNNEKFGYKVELPGRWQQMGGDPKSNSVQFFDQTGNKGSFQVNANWMSADFPVQSSLQAMEKQYQDRLKHGELEKFYRKDFTVKDPKNKTVSVFQGYVTIETPDDPDPDIRRMQWIGYAKGNYYNFTWAAKPEQFDPYRQEFEQILNKIQFIQ